MLKYTNVFQMIQIDFRIATCKYVIKILLHAKNLLGLKQY